LCLQGANDKATNDGGNGEVKEYSSEEERLRKRNAIDDVYDEKILIDDSYTLFSLKEREALNYVAMMEFEA